MMPTIRESTTAVVARGQHFRAGDTTEPYEAGWASEAVVFLLGMDDAAGGVVKVQISPDGMNWADEGAQIRVPDNGETSFARVSHFGNWLRFVADLPEGAERRMHVTVHLKG